MKNDAWNSLLVGLLIVASASTVVLAFTYANYKKRVVQLQLQTSLVNQDISIMQSLATEVSDYSKTHPAIVPILRDLQERVRAGSAEPVPPK